MTDEPDWEPMETAPRDQTVIEAMLPNDEIKRIMWAWGGGWAVEWDRRRPAGVGSWLSLNDTHQPIKWRRCEHEDVVHKAMAKLRQAGGTDA